MNIKQLILATITILFLLPAQAVRQERDSIIVSLITCWPGAEVYELCGHEAIRVRTATPQSSAAPIDSVWNYGVFDFAQPNFIYRFVKGETDYMLASYPFAYFLPEYAAADRKVAEQDLNLTQDEAWKLLGLLREEALPENREYRYNYVKDNCATRILERLDQATGASIVYPDSVKYGTFRNEMRAYHSAYPWYQFGIDIALGSGIDSDINGREEMFVPLEMMEKASGARFSDGRPLVSQSRVLLEGRADATLGPTHWSATPMACCWAFFGCVLATCFLQLRKRRIYRMVYTVWFGILGLAGSVVVFLVFASSHEATSPNLLLAWLNPLQFLIAIGVWLPGRGKRLATGMAWYDIMSVILMLIAWPFQAQSANPAIFPLMGATLALAATYAIMAFKKSL